jgi:hypothetical protein
MKAYLKKAEKEEVSGAKAQEESSGERGGL